MWEEEEQLEEEVLKNKMEGSRKRSHVHAGPVKETQDINEAISISDVAESITIHGFPRIISSKHNVIKVFWFLVFFAAFGVLVWFIFQRIVDYKRHEVYIKTESKVEQPLPFPAVTVCNSDRFSGNPLKAFSMEKMACNKTSKNNSLITRQEIEFKKACRMFLSGYKDKFRFDGDELPGFPLSFTSTNGIYPCFTFNKNGTKHQSVGGAGKGLDMMFFTNPFDVFDAKTNWSRFDDQRRGILIQIHDPKAEVSFDHSSSIVLSPGSSTEIVIKREEISRKEHPFPSKCHTSETSEYKLIEGRYTRSNCLSSCFLLKLRKECGDTTSQNKSKQQLECEADLYKRQPIDDCNCPSPCFELTYPRTVSVNVWPRRFQLDSLKDEFSSIANVSIDNITTEFLRKRFAKIKIYYQDLLNTKTGEEELYGISNLLSEIGGLMGLFLGCSVISLVEVTWLGALVMKVLLVRIIFRSHQCKDNVNLARNREMGINNRNDNIAKMTGLDDYNELVNTSSPGYYRKNEQTC